MKILQLKNRIVDVFRFDLFVFQRIPIALNHPIHLGNALKICSEVVTVSSYYDFSLKSATNDTVLLLRFSFDVGWYDLSFARTKRGVSAIWAILGIFSWFATRFRDCSYLFRSIQDLAGVFLHVGDQLTKSFVAFKGYLLYTCRPYVAYYFDTPNQSKKASRFAVSFNISSPNAWMRVISGLIAPEDGKKGRQSNRFVHNTQGEQASRTVLHHCQTC